MPEGRGLDWSAAFDELVVGATFQTAVRAVTAADVDLFAALTGDRHPQHVDAEWAADSPFGERIAHGLLVVALAAGLVPFDPARVVALRRLSEVVFKRPVRLGERIRVTGRVSDTRPAGAGAGLVALAWTIEDGDGRAACRARVEVLWSRAPLPADPYAAPEPGGFVPLPL
jgi:acyl dehydratase